MARLRITRRHALGLERARRMAWAWAERAERELGARCRVEEGEHGDTVAFARPGISGTLRVEADRLQLHAHLGFPLSLASGRIEAKIEHALDRALRDGAG